MPVAERKSGIPLSVEISSRYRFAGSGGSGPRKVGIPLSWLTPAPVSTTHGCASRIRSASFCASFRIGRTEAYAGERAISLGQEREHLPLESGRPFVCSVPLHCTSAHAEPESASLGRKWHLAGLHTHSCSSWPRPPAPKGKAALRCAFLGSAAPSRRGRAVGVHARVGLIRESLFRLSWFPQIATIGSAQRASQENRYRRFIREEVSIGEAVTGGGRSRWPEGPAQDPR